MKKLFILSLPLLASVLVFSQSISRQLVGAAGESYKNASYQLDWSIGELQTETYKATGQTLTQGFHQGNYLVTAIEQAKDLKFEITAFPNPTTDFIGLKFDNSKPASLQYTITDMIGKVLQTGRLCENNQQINFANYTVGTYFIIIKQNNQFVKSFKIIKNAR
jgi:hypothetical protein